MTKKRLGLSVKYLPNECNFVVTASPPADEADIDGLIERLIGDGTLLRAAIDYMPDGSRAFQLGTLNEQLPETDTYEELGPHVETWLYNQLRTQ